MCISHCELLQEEDLYYFLRRQQLLEWGCSKSSLKMFPRHKDTVRITCAANKQFFCLQHLVLEQLPSIKCWKKDFKVGRSVMHPILSFSYLGLIGFCAAAEVHFVLALNYKVWSLYSFNLRSSAFFKRLNNTLKEIFFAQTLDSPPPSSDTVVSF